MFELRIDGVFKASHANEAILLDEKAKFSADWDAEAPCPLLVQRAEEGKEHPANCATCGGSGVKGRSKMGADGLAYDPARIVVRPMGPVAVRRNGAIVESAASEEEAAETIARLAREALLGPPPSDGKASAHPHPLVTLLRARGWEEDRLGEFVRGWYSATVVATVS